MKFYRSVERLKYNSYDTMLFNIVVNDIVSKYGTPTMFTKQSSCLYLKLVFY